MSLQSSDFCLLTSLQETSSPPPSTTTQSLQSPPPSTRASTPWAHTQIQPPLPPPAPPPAAPHTPARSSTPAHNSSPPAAPAAMTFEKPCSSYALSTPAQTHPPKP